MKKIITLNDIEFAENCLKLSTLAKDCKPSLYIAIATGGVYVAEKMGLDHFALISSSRNNKTKKSKKIVQYMIKILPRWINNFLRQIEFKIQLSKWDNTNRNIIIDADTINELKKLDPDSTILIIDDAIDSGNSLIQIIEEIKKINQNIKIKSAVIVVTEKEKAKYLPDFYLYENVLIRFPWALDA